MNRASLLFLLSSLLISTSGLNCQTCTLGIYPFNCDPGCPCFQDPEYCSSRCCDGINCITTQECNRRLEQEDAGLQIWAIVVIVIMVILLLILLFLVFAYCFDCCTWVFCCCPLFMEERRRSRQSSRSSGGGSYQPPEETAKKKQVEMQLETESSLKL